MLNGYDGNYLTEVNPSWGFIVSTTDSLEGSLFFFFFFFFFFFLHLERCLKYSYLTLLFNYDHGGSRQASRQLNSGRGTRFG